MRMSAARRCALIALALLLAALPGLALAAGEESPYFVEVDVSNQIVTIYAREGQEHSEIVRQMICSTGTGGEDATPLGEYAMKQYYETEREEWYYIKQYQCYVRYPSRIHDAYLFHSLPYAEKDVASIDEEARSQLGWPTSHGCVRLRSEDAEWIAKNCPDGTVVRFYQSNVWNAPLRDRLLRWGYDSAEWESYNAYLAADIPSGLTGAIEALRAAEK